MPFHNDQRDTWNIQWILEIPNTHRVDKNCTSIGQCLLNMYPQHKEYKYGCRMLDRIQQDNYLSDWLWW